MRYEVEGIILAGGLGKRMGNITRDEQKCLLSIDGKPIIGHILDNLILAFGSIDLKISIGFKGEDVKNWIDANKPKSAKITYVADKTEAGIKAVYLGTESFLKGSFISLTGDVLATPEVYKNTYGLFLQSQSDMILTLSPNLEEADSHGVAKLDGFTVFEYLFPPPKNLEPDHFRDMSIYVTNHRLFELFRKYPDSKIINISSLLNKLSKIDDLNITGYCHVNPWVHIGYPQDLMRAFDWVQINS